MIENTYLMENTLNDTSNFGTSDLNPSQSRDYSREVVMYLADTLCLNRLEAAKIMDTLDPETIAEIIESKLTVREEPTLAKSSVTTENLITPKTTLYERPKPIFWEGADFREIPENYRVSYSEAEYLGLLKMNKARGIGPYSTSANIAAANGWLSILKWLESQDILPDENDNVANYPAFREEYRVMDWLATRGYLPHHSIVREAMRHSKTKLLDWLLRKGVGFSEHCIHYHCVDGGVEVLNWMEHNGKWIIKDSVDYAFLTGNMPALTWFRQRRMTPSNRAIEEKFGDDNIPELVKWLKDNKIDYCFTHAKEVEEEVVQVHKWLAEKKLQPSVEAANLACRENNIVMLDFLADVCGIYPNNN